MHPIPIHPKGKRPIASAWADRSIAEDLAGFSEGSNVGVILGAPSGDLVDLDLDSPEALLAASILAPPTASFGRASKPRSHLLFRCPGAETTTHAHGGTMHAEIRSTGVQTVFPGSVHESGEPILWHENTTPIEITPADLRRLGGDVSAVALLARHWPKDGHEARLAFAGGLLSSEVDDARAERLLRAVATVAGHGEADVSPSITSTRKRLDAGEEVRGWGSLAQTIDPRVVDRVRDWLGCAERAASIEWVGAGELAAPLGPVPWLVKDLDLCPGAPALLAGYGFSGKTLAAQALAVAVASGSPLWGSLQARQGPARHLDYEQGHRLTAERYQRLSRAAGVELRALPLSVAVLPRLDLGGRGVERLLAKACEGAALVLVDSLRASAPNHDENSSEIRSVLDTLGRVSESTGATVLVIHHARKPSREDKGGAQMAIRGSGAIFDACSSVLVFDGVKGEPVTVSHEKARTSGTPGPDLHLEISDVPREADPRWGLAARIVRAEKRDEDRDLEVQILAFIRGCHGPGPSKQTITDAMGRKADRTRAAIARLESKGAIVNHATGRGTQYHEDGK